MTTSTQVSHEGASVPGPGVSRRRLVGMLQHLDPPRLFLLAPAGYGKTYLAAQIAASQPDRVAVWVECQNQALSGEALLGRVADALSRAAEDVGVALSTEVRDASRPVADLAVRIRQLINLLPGTGVCIVLDALRLDDALHAMADISLDVSGATGSRLIVTAREIPEDGYSCLSDFHFIESEDLRFSVDEVAEMITQYGSDDPDKETVSAMLEASSGQAAVASVLARHFVSRRDQENWHVPASADLSTLLMGLAEQLRQPDRELVYFLAVVGSASIADLRGLYQWVEAGDLIRLAEAIPLVRVTGESLGVGLTAHMHAVAQDVFASRRYAASIDSAPLRRRALSLLEQRGDYDRVVSQIAASPGNALELSDWLERNGRQAAAAGARVAVREAIDSLPTTSLLSRPSLLILGARLESDLSLSEQALVKATAARDLARSSGETELEVEASLVMTRALIDQCRLKEALVCLEAVGELPRDSHFSDHRSITLSYLLAHAGLQLDAERARAADEELAKAVTEHRLSTEVVATVQNRRAGVAMMFGDMYRSLSLFADTLDLHPLAVDIKATALSNRATLLMEVGKLDHALEVAREGEDFAVQYGLSSHRDACLCTKAAIGFVLDGGAQSLDVIEEALRRFVEARDRASEDFARMYLAVMHRAAKRMSASMVHVDRTLEQSEARGIEYFKFLAQTELAANYLALGDSEAASRWAEGVRELCALRNAEYHVIRADMVLAEVARREGRDKEARTRLIDHEEYILSENANWSIAMYIRAFPHLLGLLAAALGPERLPTHMLRMVTGHHVDESLGVARKILEEPDWQLLAYRMLGEEGADRIAALSATAPCRVRLFGGLEVSVGTRQVLERDWRKRKARLLFAMLVLQQGKDVPRDQVYDHLWPEMDADRSRNNFYVIWSSMKGALVPDSGKGEACPYVEHSGGVCKVVPEHVCSDVADFDALISSARQWECDGHPDAAVRDYERLADLYRGDLLPGDVYDDWFSSARNHYRHELCDAMLAAHRLLTDIGDHPGALRMVRRGIAADPWREDLYQAALRSHISSGQRSAAIDTYLSCRAHLAEQLGLDPSSETLRLYEQILAMEERPDERSVTE